MPIRVARFVIARNAPGMLKSSGNSGTRSAGKCGNAIIYYQKHKIQENYWHHINLYVNETFL